MPDWNAYKEAYKRGLLKGEDRRAFEESMKRGLVPGMGREELQATQNQINRAVLETDPEKVGRHEADALSNTWLENLHNVKPENVSWFEEDIGDPNKRLKQIQHNLDPDNHEPAVQNQYDQFREMNWKDQGWEAFQNVENVWNVVQPPEQDVYTGIGSGAGIIQTPSTGELNQPPARKKELFDKLTWDERDKLIKARKEELKKSMYSRRRNILKNALTPAGEEYVSNYLKTGESAPETFKQLNKNQQQVVTQYIQTVKPEKEVGILHESADRFIEGAGRLAIQGFLGTRNSLQNIMLGGAIPFLGEVQVGRMTQALERMRQENALLRAQNIEKYPDRKGPVAGFLGDALPVVAESLPMMFALNPYTAGYTGPFVFGQIKHTFTDELVRRGVPMEKANVIGNAVAIGNTALERVGAEAVLGRLGAKVGSKLQLAPAASKGFFRNLSKRTLQGAAVGSAEHSQELAQGILESVGRDIGLSPEETNTIAEDVAETHRQAWEASVLFGGFGAGGRAIANWARSPQDFDMAQRQATKQRGVEDDSSFKEQIEGQEDNYDRVNEKLKQAESRDEQLQILADNDVQNVDQALEEFENERRTESTEEEHQATNRQQIDLDVLSEENLQKKSREQLQQIAENYGLKKGGKKQKLIDRLTQKRSDISQQIDQVQRRKPNKTLSTKAALRSEFHKMRVTPQQRKEIQTYVGVSPQFLTSDPIYSAYDQIAQAVNLGDDLPNPGLSEDADWVEVAQKIFAGPANAEVGSDVETSSDPYTPSDDNRAIAAEGLQLGEKFENVETQEVETVVEKTDEQVTTVTDGGEIRRHGVNDEVTLERLSRKEIVDSEQIQQLASDADIEISPPDVPFSLEAQDQAVEQRRVKNIRRKVENFRQKIGVPTENITIADSIESLDEETRSMVENQADRAGIPLENVTGFLNPETGQIYLFLDSFQYPSEAIAKLMHEAIGHYGLRNALGEEYASQMDRVYNEVGEARINRTIDVVYQQRLPGESQADYRHRITEEYLATIAERVRLNEPLNEQERGIWRRVLDWFKRLLGIPRQELLNETEGNAVASVLRRAVDYGQGEWTPWQHSFEGARFAVKDNMGDFSSSQRKDRARKSAVHLAHRIFKGEEVTEETVREMLRPFGLMNKTTQVFNRAQRIAENLKQRREQFANDTTLLQALREHELEDHYRSQVDQAFNAGMITEQRANEIKREHEQIRQKAERQRARARRGISRDDLQDQFNISLTEIQNIPDKVEYSDFANRIKDAVKQRLVAEGFMGENETVAGNDVALAEYAVTWRNILYNLAHSLPRSRERESLIKGAERRRNVQKIQGVDGGLKQLLGTYNKGRVRTSRDNLIKEIDKELNEKEFKRRVAGRRELVKVKFAPATARWLKLVRQVRKLGQGKANEIRENAVEFLQRSETLENNEEAIAEIDTQRKQFEQTFSAMKDFRDMPLQDAVVLMIKALDSYSALKQKTPAQLVDLLEQIQEDKAGAAAEVQDAFLQRQADNQQKRNIFINATKKRRKTPRHPRERGVIQRAAEWVFSDNSSFVNELRSVGDYATPEAYQQLESLTQDLTTRIQQADSAIGNEVRQTTKAFQQAVKRIYGTSFVKATRNLLEPRDEYKRFSKQEIPQPLSKANLIQIYVTGLQPEYWENFKEHGRDGQYWEDLLGEITEQDRQFIQWFHDYYRSDLPELSKTSKQITGIGVQQPNPWFMPGAFKKIDGKSIMESHVVPTIIPPTLETRVNHKRDVDETADVLTMWSQRLRQHSHFKHMAPIAQEMRGIFQAEDINTAIEEVIGQRERRTLLEHASDIMSGTPRTPDGRGYDLLRRMTGFLGLGFNFAVSVGQMTSFPAFWLEPNVNMAKTITFPFKHPKQWAEIVAKIARSSQLKNRMYFGHSEFVQNMISRGAMGQGKANELLTSISRAGYFAISIGDIVPTHLAGPAIYMDYYQKEIDTHGDPEIAESKAMDNLFRITNNTQQSRTIQGMARWQRRSTTLGKLFGIFHTSPVRFLDYEANALRQLLRNPTAANMKYAARVAFINHVLLPGMYFTSKELINAALGDEPDEGWTKELMANMAVGPISGLLVWGSLVDSTMRFAITGNEPWHTSISPAATLTQVGLDTVQVIKEGVTGDIEEMLKEADQLMSNFAGYQDVSRAIKGDEE